MLGLAVSLSCSAPPAVTDPDPISILLIVIWAAGVFLIVKIPGLPDTLIPFSPKIFVSVVDAKL